MCCAPFERIPTDLLCTIASYLTLHDVVQISQASRHLHDSISMTMLTLPEPIIHSERWVGAVHGGDIPCRETTIPLPLRSKIHTVRLSGLLPNQGQGDQHGKLYIIATSPSHCRLVAESPLVPHKIDRFKLEFPVRDGETYAVWYSVGGGGGYELLVKDVMVSIVVLSDRERYLERNFCALVDQGAFRGFDLGWHFRMLQSMCRSLLAQLQSGNVADGNFTSFLETIGIVVNEDSLLALEFIASSMITLGDEEVFTNDDDIVRRGKRTQNDIDVLEKLFPAAAEMLNCLITDFYPFPALHVPDDDDDDDDDYLSDVEADQGLRRMELLYLF